MLISTLVSLFLVLEPQAAVLPGSVGTGPQPALNPIAWEFELRFEDPKRIEVSVPGRGTQTYWYMLYTVTNTSDRTQRFYPTFQIVTENLKVFDTDVGIPPTVFNAIRDLHKLQYKYLVAPAEAIGDLRTGEDNARESVAIWREIDLNVNHFSVFVAGLSGEANAVKNPAYDPETPESGALQLDVAADGRATAKFPSNPRYFTLRKTLQIDYALPGAADARDSSAPRRLAVRWVMR